MSGLQLLGIIVYCSNGPAGFLLSCLYSYCQHGSYIVFGMALADESFRVSIVLRMQGPRRHGKAMVLFEGFDPMCSAHSLSCI